MTLKQKNRERFHNALEEYKTALRTKTDIVGASVKIQAALGFEGVPKRWKTLVNRAFKDAQTPKQEFVACPPDPYTIMLALSQARPAPLQDDI